MNKRMSYNDHLKKRYMEQKKNRDKTLVASLYSQMIFDEAWLKYKKKCLEQAIDQSLDDGDRETFMELSEEYNKIMSVW